MVKVLKHPFFFSCFPYRDVFFCVSVINGNLGNWEGIFSVDLHQRRSGIAAISSSSSGNQRTGEATRSPERPDRRKNCNKRNLQGVFVV